MNRKTVGLAGLFFFSGMALVMVLAYLDGGAKLAGAQGVMEATRAYEEGMGGTGVAVNTQAPLVTRSPEGTDGQSGMQNGLNGGAGNRAEITGGGSGGSMQLVYRFNGVTDDGKKGQATRKQATSVHCTNFDAATAQIQILLYQFNGTTVYTATFSLAPNSSKTTSTQNTTIYYEDKTIDTGVINQGSGQIFSSTPDIICTAQALDPLNNPPLFATSLEMYKQ